VGGRLRCRLSSQYINFRGLFSRERSSTGSNDCFVVVLVLVVLVVLVVFYPLVVI
jgi:hypothetical protein